MDMFDKQLQNAYMQLDIIQRFQNIESSLNKQENTSQDALQSWLDNELNQLNRKPDDEGFLSIMQM